MSIQTNIHLRGVPSVRILTDPEPYGAGRKVTTPWVTIDTNDGNEVTFYGQPGKLLALFRAIETLILERDPDSEIFFDHDQTCEEFREGMVGCEQELTG